jgi:hypothetical protein
VGVGGVGVGTGPASGRAFVSGGNWANGCGLSFALSRYFLSQTLSAHNLDFVYTCALF